MSSCEYESEWGRCAQPWFIKGGETFCIFHIQWIERLEDGIAPDPAYHRKIVEGLLEPSLGVLSDSEIRALMGGDGQRRNRGRHLDQWKLPP